MMDELIVGSVWWSMVSQGEMGQDDAIKYIPQIESLAQKGQLDIYAVACVIAYLSTKGYKMDKAIIAMDEMIEWWEDTRFLWNDMPFYSTYFHLRFLKVGRVEQGLLLAHLLKYAILIGSNAFEDFALQFGQDKNGFGVVRPVDEQVVPSYNGSGKKYPQEDIEGYYDITPFMDDF